MLTNLFIASDKEAELSSNHRTELLTIKVGFNLNLFS